jgi:hypothetical protein
MAMPFVKQVMLSPHLGPPALAIHARLFISIGLDRCTLLDSLDPLPSQEWQATTSEDLRIVASFAVIGQAAHYDMHREVSR